MSNHTSKPVFFDPELRRWRRFKGGTKLVLGLGLIIFGVLAVNLFITPVLPSIQLGQPKSTGHGHSATAEPENEAARQAAKKKGEAARPTIKPTEIRPVTAPTGSGGRPQSIGFFVNWDDTSFTSLKHNIGQLDVLVPEWLHLADADGTITPDDPARQKEVLAFVRAQRPDLKIVPLVNNFVSDQMQWQDKTIAKMLANPAARARVVEQLLAYVKANGFAGVSIDFENIPETSQPMLRTFMGELGETFHKNGLEVTMNVPVADANFDYRAYAKACDQLILMAYDEHWSESTAGPVASRKWFNDAVRARMAELPADKFIVALGNYGYDWKGTASKATEITYQEAMQTARDSEGTIALDPASLNPTFDYYDEADAVHHVWFLDAVTTFNEMVETNPLHPHGYALWRLGAEDPSIWGVFGRNSQPNEAAIAALRTIHYGYDIDYEGEGEILKVASEPRDGSRGITFDANLGIVLDEKVSAFASPYVIQRWGASTKKKIALTFDDGPDAEFTPAILNVLKENHAPATFFIVGTNANMHPELLRRMMAEGHEVGNHTYTHPNISIIGNEQVTLELNATQRLLESQIGRRTLLFRPPYAEDVEPENPEQVKPLLEVGQRGYYTVGMQIDPNDWKSPGTDAIVASVIEQAEAGQGNIVLLHDSGGDRSQTVAALPRIIRTLREKGYELVTVSDLMGVNRDAVMPIVPASEKVSARVDDAGFSIIGFGGQVMGWLFMLGIVLGVTRVLFVSGLAIFSKFQKRPLPAEGVMPRVSVIVPAYNEEKVVCETVASLLASDYENFDIIVVDDGSSDGTYAKVVEQYGTHPKVRVLTKTNGGKSAALNFGISQTDAEVVVGLDADTVFQKDTLRLLVSHFADAAVGAVAGNAKVGNRVNLMTRWQALEYVTSQNLDRRAYDVLNCISVVPGAIGAWRRELVVQAGGFTGETLAEDADLTISILRMGYRIRYEDRAIARTEAPDSTRTFLKQRFRWMFGTLQAVWKHRDIVFRRKNGALGMFALPNVLIFQIFFPLISPIMDALMLAAFANAVWQRTQHPGSALPNGLWHALFYYALFLAVDFGAALVAFILEPREDKRLLIWLFPQRFFYRQLMYYVAIKSILTAIRGSLVGWGKLERKATVRMNEG